MDKAQRWDYLIRSYCSNRMSPKTLMMETTHRCEVSRDMELSAIAACGRWAQVEDLRTGTISTIAPPATTKVNGNGT